MEKKLENYLKASFPIISISSAEEVNTLAVIKKVAASTGRRAYCFSITRGVVCISDEVDRTEETQLRDIQDPIQFLNWIGDQPELQMEGDEWIGGGVYVFLDPGKWLDEDPMIVRSIKDRIVDLRKGKTLVFLAIHTKIPDDLAPYVTSIDTPLPNRRELASVVEEVNGQPVEENLLDKVVTSLRGLTTDEASDAIALSLVETGELDPRVIMREKCSQLSKLEFLQVIDSKNLPDPSEVGGLDNLKEFLGARRDQFSKKARDFGLPTPRGVLLIGPPGTGKSLTVKASGGVLGLPVVALNAGALFDQYVGNSERNIRLATKIAEAMAPCVLWIDELEKQFSTGSGGQQAHEVTTRIIGELLTWMEEKTAPVFIMATANNIQALASSMPELLRKGRFDEIFFLDLPGEREREEIWGIQIESHGRSRDVADLKELARSSANWTGAEIEGAVREGLTLAFAEGAELDREFLLRAVSSTVPQYELARESIQSLRDWAERRARPANRVDRKKNSKARSIQK